MMSLSKYTSLILWFCVIGAPFCAFSQLEKVQRAEFPINLIDNPDFEVYPLAEDGALVLVRNNGFGVGKEESWQFVKYDTTLAPIWTQTFKLDYKYTTLMTYHSAHDAYWLFRESDTEHYLFLRLSLETGDLDLQKGDLLQNVNVRDFKVIGSKALVAGYHRERPIVMVHSFFDQTTRVLPNLYDKNTELHNVEINEANGNINVITYAYRNKNCHFQVKTYNYDGKLLKTSSLSNVKNSLISGQIVRLDDELSYLIGNYSVGCTQYSQGLYVSKIEDYEPVEPEYIEFSEFKNLFNYMSPKRKARTLEKIDRRKSRGKENRFRYRLLVHNLIQTEDEIILLAEIYYPNYKNNTVNTYQAQPGFNRNYNYSQRVQQGYQYTHAIVCGFDKNGNYKWDNSIAIKDLRSNELQEMVQLTSVDDYFVLAYPHEGNIHTEVIRREKVVVETKKYEIEPKAKNLFGGDNSVLSAWYGNSFLSYGRQKANNSRLSTNEVFYLSKLKYNLEEIKVAGLTGQ